MQIPKEFQRYTHPTLIAVGDFEHTKLYLAHEETIEEIAAIKAPEPLQPFTDASVHSSGMRTANPSTDMDEGARRSPYAKNIAAQVTDMVWAEKIEHLMLVMPAEMCRRVTEQLPTDVRPKVLKTIEAHMIDAPLVDVLERLSE